MDQIETLISERPHFHAWPDGRPANWSVAPDVLRFIRASLKPSMRTLETGAGQTTVAFAITGTHHVCITPDRTQAERIRSYCSEHGIKDTVTFINESSNTALASGQGIPDVIDFVFIDGAHRFAFPILDWHFTQRRVPVGGILAVDDYLMPSVRILHDFLLGETHSVVPSHGLLSGATARRSTSGIGRIKKINKAHLARYLNQSNTGSRPQGIARFVTCIAWPIIYPSRTEGR
jgi:hypothetical protein